MSRWRCNVCGWTPTCYNMPPRFLGPPPVRTFWKCPLVKDALAGHADDAKRVSVDLYGPDGWRLKWALLLLETYDIDCNYDSVTLSIYIEDKPQRPDIKHGFYHLDITKKNSEETRHWRYSLCDSRQRGSGIDPDEPWEPPSCGSGSAPEVPWYDAESAVRWDPAAHKKGLWFTFEQMTLYYKAPGRGLSDEQIEQHWHNCSPPAESSGRADLHPVREEEPIDPVEEARTGFETIQPVVPEAELPSGLEVPSEHAAPPGRSRRPAASPPPPPPGRSRHPASPTQRPSRYPGSSPFPGVQNGRRQRRPERSRGPASGEGNIDGKDIGGKDIGGKDNGGKDNGGTGSKGNNGGKNNAGRGASSVKGDSGIGSKGHSGKHRGRHRGGKNRGTRVVDCAAAWWEQSSW